MKKNNKIVGYIEIKEIQDGKCGNHIKPFSTEELVSDSTPLLEVLRKFNEKNLERLFIINKTEVSYIVTKSDLQKIPVRMFIFSLLSFLEMKMIEIIDKKYPNDKWMKFLEKSEKRKIEKSYKKKKSKNENLKKINCAYFSQLTKIMKKIKLKYGYNLNEIFDESLNEIRNNIAHSQDLGNKELDMSEIIKKVLTLYDFIKNLNK